MTELLNSSLSMEDLCDARALSDSFWNVRTNYAMPSVPTASMHIDEQEERARIDMFHSARSVSDATGHTLRRLSGRNAAHHAHNKTESNLLDEITDKYFTEQGIFAQSGAAIFGKAISSPTKYGCTLPGKRDTAGHLELLVVNDANISTLGDVMRLSQLVYNVVELDLTGNLLHDWKHVTCMLQMMPCVKLFNLSHNALTHAPPVAWAQMTAAGWTHKCVRALVLNATNCRWPALYALMDMLPNVQELHLSLNDYSTKKHWPSRALLAGNHTVNGRVPSYPNVRELYVNCCHIDQWRALCRICTPFYNVQDLIVAENPLSSVVCGDKNPEACYAQIFANVRTLNLNRTNITCWSAVTQLGRAFSALTVLRLNEIPLLQPIDDAHRWHLCVARLPHVQVLNGSKITIDQRVDAERFYLRFYAPNNGSMMCDSPERYAQLERVHGQLGALADIDLRPKRAARVRCVCAERELDTELDVQLTHSVLQLKRRLAALVGTNVNCIRVYYVDYESPMGPEELKLNSVALHSLGVKDGDQLIVEVGASLKYHFNVQLKPQPQQRVARPPSSTSSSGSSRSKKSTG